MDKTKKLIEGRPFKDIKDLPYYQTELTHEMHETTDYESKLVHETYDRFIKLKAARVNVAGKNIEDVWNDAEQKLMNYVEETDDDKPNLFIPITHATVDSILSEWMRQHTTGRVAPSEDEEDEPAAQLIDLCRQYVEKINNLLKVDEDTHYNIVGYGNGIQKIYYKKGRRMVRVPGKVNDDGTIEYTSKIIDDFDDICIENVDLREFYPDDACKDPSLSDCGDCIERKVLAWSTFITEYSEYDNSQYVKRNGDTVWSDFYERPSNQDDDDVEVLIWWNKNRDFERIVANNILLTDIPIPYDHKGLPFCGSGNIRRPGQFWWIGEPELLKPQQEEYNTYRSIRLAASKLAVLNPIFAPTSGKLEEDEIILEPGKIYYYQGSIPPTPLQPNNAFQTTYAEESSMKDDMAGTTGVDRRSEGLATTDSTATEAAIRKESTLKRIAKKIYQNQIMLEQRRGQLIVSLILQYYTVPKITLVAGKDNVEDYTKAVEKAKSDDSMMVNDEGVYKKTDKRIRVDNKEIKIKPNNAPNGDLKNFELQIREKKGYSFFNMNSDLVNKGKYDFIIVPDFDIPITRAAEVEMINMMYDRLQNNAVINSPDGKIHITGPQGDIALPMPKGMLKLTEMFLKKNGFDSEEFLPEDTESDPMLQQAMKESVMMMKGVKFGPTPLASPEHTMVHNKFMEANVDESMPDVQNAFNEHILGETQFLQQLANDQKISSAAGSRMAGIKGEGAPASPAPGMPELGPQRTGVNGNQPIQ